MKFRKVTAIIRPERLEKVEECLRKLNVPGISVTRVKGFGEHIDFFKPDWLCQHVRVEVFIGAGQADKVAAEIMDAAYTGREGDGIVAVLPVESVYHVRKKKNVKMKYVNDLLVRCFRGICYGSCSCTGRILLTD